MRSTSTKVLLTIIICFSLLYTAQSQQINAYNYTLQKNLFSSKGAVVSAHALASEAGAVILAKGGNAIDAAIAVQLALAVVYPNAGNIGGGGFMVAHLKDGRNISIDYRETAPANASRDMYLDATGNPQMNLSQDGHLSAGIPGTIAGLFASMKYAKLKFSQLIEPAIRFAEYGFSITEGQAKTLNALRAEFIRLNTATPVFVKNGDWKKGDTLVQKDLANTLKRIRDLGAKGFYEGVTAEMIVNEMIKGKGIITKADLKNYVAKTRTPITFPYHNCTIVTMPLPSSGGIILEQMMKMIEHRNIGRMKFETPQSVQLMTEVERRAFADRAKFLGDPDFIKVPIKAMVSSSYLADKMKDYDPLKAGSSKITQAGNIPESEETTHLNVTDKEGNAVSVTTTLNGLCGSRTVVSGAGFLLNNEMDDFSVKPGVPNMYGAVGGEANAIAPNKRMLSSMTPTIVLKNNKPYFVVGTPGGTTIPTSVFQTLVDVLDFGMSIDRSVNLPKFHHQWLPDEIFVEKGFPLEVRDALSKMGYKITERGGIGRTEVLKITGKVVEAAADKRGDDSAAKD